MRTTYIIALALFCAAGATACSEPTAAGAARDLDLFLPPIEQMGAPLGLAIGEPDEPPPERESDPGPTPIDGAPPPTYTDSVAPDTVWAGDSLPPGAPEELRRPVTILTYWSDAMISSGYAWGVAFMEYIAAAAEQALTLNLTYNMRPLTSVTVNEAQSFFLPVHSKVKTTASIPVTATCGLALLATSSHLAKNEFQIFPRPILFSKEQVSSQGNATQPACQDEQPPPPPPSDGSSGGGGPAPEEATRDAILDCWWIYHYVGNQLVEVEKIACQIIS